MFPVHLFVQLAEVVVFGSFQELTPSVRGTISMFATVVVDMPSLSHHLMWLNLRSLCMLTDFEACDTTSVATVKAFFSWKIICGC